MRGFTEELTAINIAEEDVRKEEERGWKLTVPSALHALGNLALGGAAYGAGAGAVLLAKPKLKQMFSTMSPEKVKWISQGVGLATAASSLALMDAIAQNAKMVREASEQRMKKEEGAHEPPKPNG
jgi:hypothetical protein